MSEPMTTGAPGLPFTPRRTRWILQRACGAGGFDATGAQLLRHHTNAVYRLVSAPVVVKIDRPFGVRPPVDVVALVRWLRERGVPTVPPTAIAQPLRIGGCTVTFWDYLPQHRPIAAVDLAAPLAALHGLRTRPAQWLPDRHLDEAFAHIARSIEASTILSPFDRRLLHDERLRLAAAAPAVDFPLRPALIHGDAHHRNTLWDPVSRRGVLCDWESVAVGRPEWDLVTLEVHCRRFAHPPTEYETFCDAYGFDIRTWPGYPWLRDLRELRMITTNAYKSTPGTPTAQEVLRRVQGLREDIALRWNIL
ncbi:phosphotransferase family protein [Nocardia sp. NPDC003482]